MKPAAAFRALKKAAAAYPGAWEDHPWGETVYKVGKKVFVFLGHGDFGYGITCKLPQSSEAAITMFSFAEPTGYGLGESGWVTATFSPKEDVPLELLKEWMAESYAAVAPKRGVPQPAPKGRRRA